MKGVVAVVGRDARRPNRSPIEASDGCGRLQSAKSWRDCAISIIAYSSRCLRRVGGGRDTSGC